MRDKIEDMAIGVGREYLKQGSGILKLLKVLMYTLIGAVVVGVGLTAYSVVN